MPEINENEYLVNHYYNDAIVTAKKIEDLKLKVKSLLDEALDENVDLKTFGDLWSQFANYREQKPRAGRRLIVDIARDASEITCVKSLNFKPLPPDGIQLSGIFKNLVFVDKTSYRKALRLPPVYFKIHRNNSGGTESGEFFTPIRNGYSWAGPRRRYMPQPHCRSWHDPCFGDFYKAVDHALCQYDIKTAIPLIRDFLCSGGGHGSEMLHLSFGDPKIRFYSPSEMEYGHEDGGVTRWCPTYSRWGKLRGDGTMRRFYISPNEWLPVVDGMEFKEYNVTNLIPCESFKRPMPDVRHLVQFDPTVSWRKGPTGIEEMWRFPLYTPTWKVRLSILEREKLARQAKKLMEATAKPAVATTASTYALVA